MESASRSVAPAADTDRRRSIALALCGDVMLGRGIDQILPHPGAPNIYETHAKSALDYVELAERASGPIVRPVTFDYVWGDALAVLDHTPPDVRIINLETSVTRRGRPWPKGINYRMSPDNIGCLATAHIDCCVLANNHVLDWGREGLLETLSVLRGAGLHVAGAGETRTEAAAPAVIVLPGKGRVLVFAFASETSGVPPDWTAATTQPGVNFVPDLRSRTAERLAWDARAVRRVGDVLVASIHWGSNWGYRVPGQFRDFAHALVDGGFDLIHGHSSHHPRGFEIYSERLILYGCGDFLNDYEGISGFEEYRPDLVLLYLPILCPVSGKLLRLDMRPFRLGQFRLNSAPAEDLVWLQERLGRECTCEGGRIALEGDGILHVRWN